MKNRFGLLAVAALMICAGVAQAQFTYKGVRLYKQIPLNTMPTAPTAGAGCTGWVSPAGREYGIMGVRTGTVIVDVTNPGTPDLLTHLPGPSSTWHENVTLNGYGYFVVDQNGNGVQIVDLNQLDTARTATQVGLYTGATGATLSSVHTIQANPASNTLYLNGSNRGLVFLDATNPVAPVEVGRWAGTGSRYVHDSYPVNYTEGPYAGKEILFASCGSNGLYILDVTNKATPVVLGSKAYIPSGGYCHSGMLTPDKKYFLINDEFDENNGIVSQCTTHIIDVQDLANPVYVGAFSNPITVIDHNSRWQDGYLLLAAYRGGLRIYDASNPLAMRETGFFDTYNGDGFSYSGAWGSFIFPSGNAFISDMQAGFIVVDPSEAMGFGAPITGLTVERGTIMGGGIRDLRRDDDVNLAINSAFSLSDKLYKASALFDMATTASPATQIAITANLRIETFPTAEVILRLKNWNTGQFDQVAAWRVVQAEGAYQTPNIPAGSYIGPNGAIQMRLTSSSIKWRGNYKTIMDRLRVAVQ
jgi:choice-of-anchor B domain-containing protein